MDMFRLFLYTNTIDHCSSILKTLLPLDSITLFSSDTPFAFVAHRKRKIREKTCPHKISF